MNPRETTILDLMIYGGITATAIILHNLFIYLYPYISL